MNEEFDRSVLSQNTQDDTYVINSKKKELAAE